MSAFTRNKAYRVTFDETNRSHVDVIACADWQAIEIARTLRESASNAIVGESEEPIEVHGWTVKPLSVGGAS